MTEDEAAGCIGGGCLIVFAGLLGIVVLLILLVFIKYLWLHLI